MEQTTDGKTIKEWAEKFNLQQAPNQRAGVCPSCGYCPHCGRGYGLQPVPYLPYPAVPYWPPFYPVFT